MDTDRPNARLRLRLCNANPLRHPRTYRLHASRVVTHAAEELRSTLFPCGGGHAAPGMARAGRRTAVLALLALLCFARPVAGGRKPRPAGLKPHASAVTGPAFVEVNGTLVATAPPKPKKPFTGTWLTRHYLNTSYYDEAVCNDQSARACPSPAWWGASLWEVA